MQSKNFENITIVINNFKLHFIYLKWDSSFFKIPCYKLHVELSTFEENSPSNKLQEILKNAFITLKLDTNEHYEIISFLQNLGFYYVDTETTLQYVKNKNISFHEMPNEIKIKKATNVSNLIPFKELGAVFSLTRFHTDLNIDNKKATLLWQQYIQNFQITNSQHLYLAYIRDKIVGAFIVIEKENIASIFFVSVIPAYQGIGIGKKILQKIIHDFSNYEIIVGTQIKNISALNFYLQNGFTKIKSTNTILHYWNKEQNQKESYGKSHLD